MVDNSTTSRRKLLKSVTATGAVAALPSIAQAKESVSKTDVQEVSGRESRYGIKQARSDSEFRTLYREYASDGWVATDDDYRVLKVTESTGETRYVVLVDFRQAGSSVSDSEAERYLLYNGLNEVSKVPQDAEGLRSSQGLRVSRKGQTPEISADTVENGAVVAGSASAAVSDLGLQDQTVTTSACVCRKPKTVCDSYNYGCIFLTAGAYVTSIVACGSCAASSGVLIPACGYCLGAVLTSAGATLSCDIGSDCSTQEVCLTGQAAVRQC